MKTHYPARTEHGYSHLEPGVLLTNESVKPVGWIYALLDKDAHSFYVGCATSPHDRINAHTRQWLDSYPDGVWMLILEGPLPTRNLLQREKHWKGKLGTPGGRLTVGAIEIIFDPIRPAPERRERVKEER